MIETVTFRFPSGVDQPLAVVDVRVEVLAQRHEITLERWEDDGLGPAVGAMCKLPSGKVIALIQHDHSVEHMGCLGPTVVADGRQLIDVGPSALLAEVVEALAIQPDQVSWRCPEDIMEDPIILKQLEWVEERREGRS